MNVGEKRLINKPQFLDDEMEMKNLHVSFMISWPNFSHSHATRIKATNINTQTGFSGFCGKEGNL